MSSSTGKKLVRIADSAVNIIVLVALMLMLALGCYSLWDGNRVYAQAASSNWTEYKPAESPTGGLSFKQLRAINPEVISWVQVYGTDIDYPVAQASDNMKYVNYNAKGEYALSGCPFLDSANASDFSDFNSIIYGHHMDVPAMFGELDNFADAAYFESHRYGTLYFDGKLHGLEFFAFLSTDAYNASVYTPAVSGEQARSAYIDNLYATAGNTRDIGVTTDDNIVLLSTCSDDDTNGRFIVVARIGDKVWENPFADAPADEGLGILDLLKMVPWWAWLSLAILLVLIVLALVKRHKMSQEPQIENERPHAEPGADEKE